MIICGKDYETTGLDPIIDRVVEVGFALWDTVARAPVFAAGFFVRPDGTITPERWAEAERVHGISMDTAIRYGFEPGDCLGKMLRYMEMADCVCAHNGNAFDKFFFDNWCVRAGVEPPEKLWIDTRIDLGIISNRLTYIAADHGFINPFPHRALTDVLTMLKVLDAYDVEAVVARARIPNVCLQALVSFDNREKAKAIGYQWRGKFKRWLKLVKLDMVEIETKAAADAGFKVQQVEKEG